MEIPDDKPPDWKVVAEINRRYAQAEWADELEGVDFKLAHKGKKKMAVASQTWTLAEPPKKTAEPVTVPAARTTVDEETFPAKPHASDDYQIVTWNDAPKGTPKKYHFLGDKQRLIVKRLWVAWESGRPEVPAKTLLAYAQAQTQKLPQLFAGHLAWGRLIVQIGQTSCYRLAFFCPSDVVEEEDDSPEPTPE